MQHKSIDNRGRHFLTRMHALLRNLFSNSLDELEFDFFVCVCVCEHDVTVSQGVLVFYVEMYT